MISITPTLFAYSIIHVRMVFLLKRCIYTDELRIWPRFFTFMESIENKLVTLCKTVFLFITK